jgi:hypothetical protein
MNSHGRNLQNKKKNFKIKNKNLFLIQKLIFSIILSIPITLNLSNILQYKI